MQNSPEMSVACWERATALLGLLESGSSTCLHESNIAALVLFFDAAADAAGLAECVDELQAQNRTALLLEWIKSYQTIPN